VVEQEIDEISPEFKMLSGLTPKLDLKLVGFGMDDARAAAWSFAQALAPLAPTQQLPLMARRDDEVALLGDVILNDGLVVRLIRAKESTDVGENIRTLAQGELTVAVPAVVTPPVPAASPASAP